MMDMERVEEIANDLDWCVCQYEDGYFEFEKYSPAGEDFSFCVNISNLIQGIRDYLDDYDPEEHAAMWIEARHTVSGVPDVATLIKDAYNIKDMIEELLDTLENNGVINVKPNLNKTIVDDCAEWQKLKNADSMFQHYMCLNKCENSEESGMYQLILDGNELWFGTLQEINAVVKSMIKLIEIEREG